MMPDVNESLCGSVGTACGTGCPSSLECIKNACVPVRGECGGIVGSECEDPSLVCTFPTGSSGGLCMLPGEKECVCTFAPSVLGDCLAE
jgi:hypothetical protein